jgi:shikimate dehydrogenase
VTPLRFAVVGDPIAHSRSPGMHAAAYRVLGLPHSYEAIRASADELPAVVARLRAGELAGLNVTVPHKERVLAWVDALADGARAAGAANTIVREASGRLVAHNTDAPALAAEIARVAGGPLRATSRALVLGSGGAARAAIVALGAYLGVRDIVVRARAFDDPARREAFVASSPRFVTAAPLSPSRNSEAATAALVQATSAGMHGGAAGEPIASAVDWDALPDDAIAIDVVYSPPETPWLRAARTRGLRCDNGYGMLARQGALAFELWLGRTAPFAAMRAALESP